MAISQVIGIDFDHTLWDNANNQPMPGAHEALDAFRERGYRILIHSCNNPQFIRDVCETHNLRVDYIWGEVGLEAGKPVCAAYIDDRAVPFRDWQQAMEDTLALVEGRPIRDYRGPVYRGNPKRQV